MPDSNDKNKCVSKKAKENLRELIEMQDLLIGFLLDKKLPARTPAPVKALVNKAVDRETSGLKEILELIEGLPDC